MNEETRQEIKQILKQMLSPIVAGVILLACMQIAQLVLSVRTDLFRKKQQVRTSEKIEDNTTAIEATATAINKTAMEANAERLRIQELEQGERAVIRKYIEQLIEDRTE